MSYPTYIIVTPFMFISLEVTHGSFTQPFQCEQPSRWWIGSSYPCHGGTQQWSGNQQDTGHILSRIPASNINQSVRINRKWICVYILVLIHITHVYHYIEIIELKNWRDLVLYTVYYQTHFKNWYIQLFPPFWDWKQNLGTCSLRVIEKSSWAMETEAATSVDLQWAKTHWS